MGLVSLGLAIAGAVAAVVGGVVPGVGGGSDDALECGPARALAQRELRAAAELTVWLAPRLGALADGDEAMGGDVLELDVGGEVDRLRDAWSSAGETAVAAAVACERSGG